MKRTHFTPVVFLALLIAATLVFTVPLRGAETKQFLADRHKERGLTCEQCHKENPPKQAAKTEACLECHGPYDKLAELIQKKVSPNPHESHNGNLPCENCHHAHKASENFCATCHDFDFKVP